MHLQGLAVDEGYNFTLRGDLAQQLTFKNFLVTRGISVGQRGSYPALRAADVERAYGLIWSERIEGWWNLEREFTSRGICTAEEFSDALQTGG